MGRQNGQAHRRQLLRIHRSLVSTFGDSQRSPFRHPPLLRVDERAFCTVPGPPRRSPACAILEYMVLSPVDLNAVTSPPATLPSPLRTSPAAPEHHLEVRSALLRLPTKDGRRWLQFSNPVESIIAWSHDEVIPALERVDAATDAGLWAVGAVSYDAAKAFDPALASKRHRQVPLIAFGVFKDHQASNGPAGSSFSTSAWTADVSQNDYERHVAAIKEPIAAGESYQVNYTMRLRAAFAGDPLGLFEALSRAQRADHLCFVDLGDAAICSASPELLFSRHGKTLTSKPMKGTRPRSIDPREDQRLIDELLSSEKDRAENTMIVDMTRNDLGRIAEIGSLQVPALHTIETYPTVHQMTSTVTATSDANLVEIFAALFPGASITGAPKVSTSRIIADVESSARGMYCGAVGAAGPGGFAEFNIAIRTVWVDLASGTAEYGTGGGIVWDSDPHDEWLEANHKTNVLLQACSGMRLLETIRYEPGTGATLLDRHLNRLADGASHFGFDVDLSQARRLIEAVELEGCARLRMTVAPNGAIDLDIAPLDTDLAATDSNGMWRLPIDTEPVNSTDELLRFKTTHRERYNAARARFPHAPDVILWNERGEVTETTIGNLVIELNGQWFTPALTSGLLAGTFRAELIDQGRIAERTIMLTELTQAHRIWMINSVRGWVPSALDTGELLVAATSTTTATPATPAT